MAKWKIEIETDSIDSFHTVMSVCEDKSGGIRVIYAGMKIDAAGTTSRSLKNGTTLRNKTVNLGMDTVLGRFYDLLKQRFAGKEFKLRDVYLLASEAGCVSESEKTSASAMLSSLFYHKKLTRTPSTDRTGYIYMVKS